MASPSPLLNVHVAAPIDGGFKSLNSKPQAQWLSETNRVLWKFTELSQHSEGNGVGSLKARVELAHGPGNQGTIFTQFNCEGTTLSGVEFELLGPGYRLSLVKRRFVSGKWHKRAVNFLLESDRSSSFPGSNESSRLLVKTCYSCCVTSKRSCALRKAYIDERLIYILQVV